MVARPFWGVGSRTATGGRAVRPPVPPHYLSFRIVLVVVLIGALAGGTWWVVQREVWTEVIRFLSMHVLP